VHLFEKNTVRSQPISALTWGSCLPQKKFHLHLLAVMRLIN